MRSDTSTSLLLLLAGLVGSCGGGPAAHAPLCQEWAHAVRDSAAPVRLLGAAPQGDEGVQVLLHQGGSVLHAGEAGGSWQSQEVERVPQSSVRGTMTLEGQARPVLLYAGPVLRVASPAATAGWTVGEPSVPVLNVLAIAAHAHAGQLPVAAVTADDGAQVAYLTMQPTGSWTVETLPLPTPARNFLAVAVTRTPDGRPWVFASSGGLVWSWTQGSSGSWQVTQVRFGGAAVVEMGVAVDRQARIQLALRTQEGLHGQLLLLTVDQSAEAATVRLLDTALAAPPDHRLLAVGTDVEGSVRILHARSNVELVHTALLGADVKRDVVELAPDAHITSVTGVVGPTAIYLVETHGADNADSQLVTHRCQ